MEEDGSIGWDMEGVAEWGIGGEVVIGDGGEHRGGDAFEYEEEVGIAMVFEGIDDENFFSISAGGDEFRNPELVLVMDFDGDAGAEEGDECEFIPFPELTDSSGAILFG